ncbi:CLUMA_CG008205, isoform A [Clunio marinus]|uniref:CLUMA_CG008205, isoform A n=1 Tax=Clunio marinus TaxID=568069 RepID=A0A1J1I8G3_9DIPT|nr:CLUMA_CG008205, isoform A [Clunio marinus]
MQHMLRVLKNSLEAEVFLRTLIWFYDVSSSVCLPLLSTDDVLLMLLFLDCMLYQLSRVESQFGAIQRIALNLQTEGRYRNSLKLKTVFIINPTLVTNKFLQTQHFVFFLSFIYFPCFDVNKFLCLSKLEGEKLVRSKASLLHLFLRLLNNDNLKS